MWQSKALFQSVVSRLPYAVTINDRLGDFYRRARGRTREAASESMVEQYRAALRNLREVTPLEGLTIVEVGTGILGMIPLLCALAGHKRFLTIDHLRHWRHTAAITALGTIRRHLAEFAETLGLAESDLDKRLKALEQCSTFEALLREARIDYVAPGDGTRCGATDASADLFFTYSVVENMPVPVFEALVVEARRVLKPGGAYYQLVGCSDPYRTVDRSLSRINYLRYADWYWNALTNNSLGFNNRMREPEFIATLERNGFVLHSITSWFHPPDLQRLRTFALAPRFAAFADDDLVVHKSEMIGRLGTPSGAGLIRRRIEVHEP